MMRAPLFWTGDGGVGGSILSALLLPAGAVYAAATRRRMARPGWRAPVPVLCCGNVTAGGAGKTTVALDLGARLAAQGVAVHALLRGYGGRLRGPVRVDPAVHGSADVGDEALLLAAQHPTWVAGDRAAGGRAAVAAGAAAILMDDGLQNPTLVKDVSLLIVDGAYGFGNGRAIPAGPLREAPKTAAGRASAIVLIGADERGVLGALPAGLPVLRASLRPGPEAAALAGQPVFAFCGIGSPEKFFATLTEAGARLAGRAAFADHHPYDAQDLRDLLAEAAALRALPVTTRKDWVRLPPAERERVTVVSVGLEWADPAAVDALLARVMAGG